MGPAGARCPLAIGGYRRKFLRFQYVASLRVCSASAVIFGLVLRLATAVRADFCCLLFSDFAFSFFFSSVAFFSDVRFFLINRFFATFQIIFEHLVKR